MSDLDVVVAGGGLSGLAAASALVRLAPGARVRVLEAESRPGGTVRTERRAGFVMEGGPEGFLDKCGALRRLAPRLGLDVIDSRSGSGRWVRRGGRLRRLPSSAASFLTSDLLGAAGSLRMLAEPLIAHSVREETVFAFAERRLGREAARWLVDPIVTGTFAGDAAELSLSATLPHLAALEARGGSLLSGFLRASGKARPIGSFPAGCASLIEALCRALGDRVACGVPVQAVRRSPEGYRVETPQGMLSCRAFVSAAPAWAARDYLAPLDPEVAWHMAQVPYAPVASVALGFRDTDLPSLADGFGYLVPGAEDTPVLGVPWSSAIFPGGRAPPGASLLRVLLGGRRHPSIVRQSDAEILGLARDEVRTTLGILGDPIAVSVTRHARGIPQYLLGHVDRVVELDARAQSHPGLFVGGSGLRGPGMDALVRDALLLGSRAAAWLADERVRGDGALGVSAALAGRKAPRPG